ncbi:NADPH dehydrogenase (plasmid) [Variovorax sp. SRS16]|uniref:NADH:flavin oxidoreductase/NADH oxidase n=1 Tax=Variovorax sp. SRS16 TaxID=282217 RepID=UPI00131992A8|nr:NADH:flavin oxidoreductase/NADH oxidase [Variovorax sp. SRS16]VTU45760.1 NADPH dehydrogenase [Variovorax sp. SRS16]
MEPTASRLFSPFDLRSVRFRNRIGVSPMCMYACGPDGLATPWHMVHLGMRAPGGAGLVVAEATAVAPHARISPADLGLWSRAHADAFAPITQFISGQGCVPGIQLAHAGRKGSTRSPWIGRDAVPESEGGWQVQAPSPLLFSPLNAMPREMSGADIARTIGEFGAAAGLAFEAGFRYVELHLGHGYLAHQFLSPLTNRRTDDWGGDFDGRTRFARELAKAARAAWPDELPLAARLSITDWVEGGWTADEAVRLAGLLGEAGVDLVVCSSGAIVPGAMPPDGPIMQLSFAARVRAQAGVASGAVGQITEAAQAEQIIASGGADLVFLARAMLRDPFWAVHAAEALGAPAPWPIAYDRAVGQRQGRVQRPQRP